MRQKYHERTIVQGCLLRYIVWRCLLAKLMEVLIRDRPMGDVSLDVDGFVLNRYFAHTGPDAHGQIDKQTDGHTRHDMS